LQKYHSELGRILNLHYVALGQQAASVPKVSMGMECYDVSNYLNCDFADTGVVVAPFIASASMKK